MKYVKKNKWTLLLLCAFLSFMQVSCQKKSQVKKEAPLPSSVQEDKWPSAQNKSDKSEEDSISEKGYRSTSGKIIPTKQISEFKKATKLLKKSPLSKEDRKEAQQIFRQLVRQQPQFVEALVNLGYTQEMEGDNSAAQSNYQKALSYANLYVPACTRLASLLGQQEENPRRALEVLEPCVQQTQTKENENPSVFAEALVVQAQLKWMMGKEKETMEDLRKAFALYPDPTGGLILRADIHRVQKEFEQSKRLYERVLSEKRLANPAKVYNNLALCEWGLKNFARAVSSWEKSQKADPSYPDPYFHLGTIALENGHYVKAEENFRKLLQINDNNAPARTLLAVTLRSQEKYLEAENEYLRALNQGGNQPEALFNLAILYHKYLKQPQKALTYYERYATVDPKGAKSNEVQGLIAQARKDAKPKPMPQPKSTTPEQPKAKPEAKPRGVKK